MFAMLAVAAVEIIPFSHHPTDDGFILSLSYRIWQGEVPHRDFIYVRPPVTLLLHTIWLAFPDGWAIPLGRWSYFLWHILIAFVLTSVLAPVWLQERTKRWWGALMPAVGMLCATMATTPSPWHTTDGLLFSTLGLTCLVYHVVRVRTGQAALGSTVALFGAGLAFGIAPLCKQNFAAGALLYALAVVFTHGFRRLTWLAAFALAVPTAVLCGWLAHEGALQAMRNQIAAASSLRSVYVSGISPYIYLRAGVSEWLRLVLLPAAGAWVMWHAHKRGSFGPFLIAVVALSVTAIAVADPKGWSASILFMLFAAGVLAADTWLSRRSLDWARLCLGVGALCIAWETQVSWGFPYPTAGLAPVAFATGVMLLRPCRGTCDEVWARWGSALLVAAVLGWSVYNYRDHAYRETPRAQQTQDLSKVFARFGPRLMTNPQTAAKYQDLRDTYVAALRQFSGKPVVTVPHFPLLYYLSGTRNRASIDWFLPNEYPGYVQLLQSELRRSVVLLQMQEPEHHCKIPVAHNPLIDWIQATGRVVGESQYLCVYVWDASAPKDAGSLTPSRLEPAATAPRRRQAAALERTVHLGSAL